MSSLTPSDSASNVVAPRVAANWLADLPTIGELGKGLSELELHAQVKYYEACKAKCEAVVAIVSSSAGSSQTSAVTASSSSSARRARRKRLRPETGRQDRPLDEDSLLTSADVCGGEVPAVDDPGACYLRCIADEDRRKAYVGLGLNPSFRDLMAMDVKPASAGRLSQLRVTSVSPGLVHLEIGSDGWIFVQCVYKCIRFGIAGEASLCHRVGAMFNPSGVSFLNFPLDVRIGASSSPLAVDAPSGMGIHRWAESQSLSPFKVNSMHQALAFVGRVQDVQAGDVATYNEVGIEGESIGRVFANVMPIVRLRFIGSNIVRLSVEGSQVERVSGCLLESVAFHLSQMGMPVSRVGTVGGLQVFLEAVADVVALDRRLVPPYSHVKLGSGFQFDRFGGVVVWFSEPGSALAAELGLLESFSCCAWSDIHGRVAEHVYALFTSVGEVEQFLGSAGLSRLVVLLSRAKLSFTCVDGIDWVVN